MGWKKILVAPYARYVQRGVEKMAQHAVEDQKLLMKKLVDRARDTQFGHDHSFSEIKDYEDFKKKVPVKDYEGLKPYRQVVQHLV